MSFDSIYHLHIPRTAGVFVRKNLLIQFKDKQCFAGHNQLIDDKQISNSYFVSGHFGQYPIKIMKNPIIFTILRDPIERFISYFNYTKQIFNEMSEDALIDYWLYDDKMSEKQSNLQFKFLSGSINKEKYNAATNRSRVENSWFIENQTSYDDTISFMDSINTFIIDNVEIFDNELSDLLGTNKMNVLEKINKSSNNNLKIYNHIDRIKELNNIDLEIYNYVKSKK